MDTIKSCDNCAHKQSEYYEDFCQACDAQSDVFDPYPEWKPMRGDGTTDLNEVRFLETLKEDVVNHPKHYTVHPSGVECIQITEHMNFCLGNAVKYLWRAGEKHETPLEDLKKARWYIDREIQRMEKNEKV